MNLVSFAIGVIVRSAALAIICIALERLLRNWPAEIRHAIWRGMLVALLLFPILLVVVPPLTHASHVVTKVESALLPSSPATNVRVPFQAVIVTRQPEPAVHPFPWQRAALGLYLGVALALVLRLYLSLRHIKAIVSASAPITSIKARELVHDTWLESGSFIKPRVRVSAEIAVPVSIQCDSEMFILLPVWWRKWEEDKLRLVLLHEMHHVKRDDPATALLACLTACLYWLHPLSWFIKHRLTALSEYACDEYVVAHACTPRQYVNALTDFAQDAACHGGRVLQPANAVVHHSELENRIRRIFAVSKIRCKGLNLLRGAVIAIMIPALYFAAATRPVAQQQAGSSSAFPNQPWVFPANAEEAAEVQAQLAAHPDDLDLHRKLLMYYMTQMQSANYVQQLLWVIQHHPEAAFPTYGPLRPEGNTAADYVRLTAAWDHALREHPDSPDVLFNAANFLQRTDPQRALDLLQHAQQLDSSPKSPRYVNWMGYIYADAIAADLGLSSNGINFTAELAAKLRTDLEGSNDPALLSSTGTDLVRYGSFNAENATLKQQGYDLLQRAIDLDPTNAKWKDALESAKYESVRQQNYREMSRPGGASGPQRIGTGVAEANLIKKVDPEYPPLALSARIQGTVDFTVTIGPDGHVEAMQLVSGHPLLVQAARKALSQWVYRPVLLNGQPVTVVTEVSIPFKLP